MIQDMRFQPFMHRLFVYDNSEPIDNDTLIYAVPNLKRSMKIDTVNWTFKNMTTGDTYDSTLTRRKFYPDGDRFGDRDEELPYGGTEGWLIVPQDTDRLKPGYYNITVRYKKENIDMSHTVDSAFLISK
jgi:hypothetical protein